MGFRKSLWVNIEKNNVYSLHSKFLIYFKENYVLDEIINRLQDVKDTSFNVNFHYYSNNYFVEEF